jgi:hypothetical protein
MRLEQDYRGGLSAKELVGALQSLFAAERTAMRLTCRYLADLADCMEAADDWAHGVDGAALALAGYADVFHVAECLFELGAHSTRERIRVGRALRSLPKIEGALVSGKLSYSRAREVTRVATPENESALLKLARTLPMRTLERRVVEASGKASPGRAEGPAQLRWSTPETVEVTLRLPAEAWALLQRAMEGARRASEASLSQAEALAAVARDALEQQNAGADTTDARHTVVLYECQSCLQTEIDTGAGPLEIGAGAAAALGCGARVRDLRTEGQVVRRGGPLPKAIERAVRLRDRNTCRVPGCARRRYVDVHHIAPRSEGGEHSRKNCVCLCTTHHARLHEGRLRIEGDAEGELLFHDATGAPLFAPVASHVGTTTAVGSDTGNAALPGASHSGHRPTVPVACDTGNAAVLAAPDGWTATMPVASNTGNASVPGASHSRQPTVPVASNAGNAAPPAASDGWTVTVPVASDTGNAAPPVASDGWTATVSVASHTGSVAAPGAFHRGTVAAAVAGAGNEAAVLLALMGRRGGWSVDALVEASGLRVGAVQYALMTLELDGRVECDAFGSYAPCATHDPDADRAPERRGMARTGKRADTARVLVGYPG